MSDTTYKVANWFADEFEALQTDSIFVAEDVILDVTEQIHTIMEEKGINQTELADRLAAVRGQKKLSRSAVSQLLSGNHNISINRLVEVALALGMTTTPPQLVDMQPVQVEPVETAATE